MQNPYEEMLKETAVPANISFVLIWSTWPGMNDTCNIFHYVKDLYFLCNELLCWTRLWGCTGLQLNSRMSQEYYFNKYLMKEDLLLIHYTVSNMCLCSLGGFHNPCLIFFVYSWGSHMGRHEYGAGSLSLSELFTDAHPVFCTHPYCTQTWYNTHTCKYTSLFKKI